MPPTPKPRPSTHFPSAAAQAAAASSSSSSSPKGVAITPTDDTDPKHKNPKGDKMTTAKPDKTFENKAKPNAGEKTPRQEHADDADREKAVSPEVRDDRGIKGVGPDIHGKDVDEETPLEITIRTTGLSRDELIDRLLVGAYSEGQLPSRDQLLG